ncbi:MAG: hypothetical protein K2X41_12890 [Hyphomicrobium sp.]|nr:hypothetical protein [Hyphomicrobium sp.]
MQKAVTKASKSIKGDRSAWVQDMLATADTTGNLKTNRLTCTLTFEVKG